MINKKLLQTLLLATNGDKSELWRFLSVLMEKANEGTSKLSESDLGSLKPFSKLLGIKDGSMKALESYSSKKKAMESARPKPVNRSVIKPVNRSVNSSVNSSVNRSVNRSVNKSVNKALAKKDAMHPEITTKSIVSCEKNLEVGSWGHYVDIYFGRWQQAYPGTKPALTGKEQGALKRIMKDLTPDQFDALWQVYLQMKDKWFEAQAHSLAIFHQNLHKIQIAYQSGGKPKSREDLHNEFVLKRMRERSRTKSDL